MSAEGGGRRKRDRLLRVLEEHEPKMRIIRAKTLVSPTTRNKEYSMPCTTSPALCSFTNVYSASSLQSYLPKALYFVILIESLKLERWAV